MYQPGSHIIKMPKTVLTYHSQTTKNRKMLNTKNATVTRKSEE